VIAIAPAAGTRSRSEMLFRKRGSAGYRRNVRRSVPVRKIIT
jgi:hypothetical protein